MKIKVTSNSDSDSKNYFIIAFSILFGPVAIFMLAAGTTDISKIFPLLVTIFANNSFLVAIVCIIWVICGVILILQGFAARIVTSESDIKELDFCEIGFSYIKKGALHRYKYSDIDSATVSIETETRVRHSKYGSTEILCVRDFIFSFHCKNDYDESIIFDSSKGDLFKFLSFYKKFQKINYELSGPYVDLRKEIELFLKTGKRVIFADDVVKTSYWIVILLSGIAAYISNIARGQDLDFPFILVIVIPTVALIGAATVLMILLEIDRNTKNSAKK
jgi:uncharacterized membrane protein YuzA (DUF378 family)